MDSYEFPSVCSSFCSCVCFLFVLLSHVDYLIELCDNVAEVYKGSIFAVGSHENQNEPPALPPCAGDGISQLEKLPVVLNVLHWFSAWWDSAKKIECGYEKLRGLQFWSASVSSTWSS
ncbi:hypothetical protein POX_e06823 [Penicillium oxalicum]|uniref:hypothetical protein n=1 Tax=Penicillium oxalicum TaxID=69781 RepID=UPI0020B7D353|nr:hypothetical protein POX_e06823 [Penicillium oxalicum]KAI2788802.1 hypothetical protein POX_e06823 [Penicillium oxalicum]